VIILDKAYLKVTQLDDFEEDRNYFIEIHKIENSLLISIISLNHTFLYSLFLINYLIFPIKNH
jgi:hypothetical protein